MSFRVIIAGGRDFDDFRLMCQKCDYYLKNRTDITIISGCARGADALGELYSRERHYKLERYPAQWNTFGKSAGYIRNEQMAENADALIAFWDGKSRGTKHMIQTAKDKGIMVRIVKYENAVETKN